MFKSALLVNAHVLWRCLYHLEPGHKEITIFRGFRILGITIPVCRRSFCTCGYLFDSEKLIKLFGEELVQAVRKVWGKIGE